MRITRLLGAMLLGAALLPFSALAAPVAATPAGPEPAPQSLLRIGIVPLRDDAEQPKLAASLTSMLRSRLGARFKGVEFIAVDPKSLGNGYSNGPLLLSEAVALGEAADVDALLDGVFGGVKIAGGSWPSMTSSAPQARGKLRWRLVECREGLLLADGVIDPDHYKAYSQRIRTEKELEKRVLQDLAAAVGEELARLNRLPEKKGALTPAPPGKDASADKDAPGGTDEANDREPISLTGDSEDDDAADKGDENGGNGGSGPEGQD